MASMLSLFGASMDPPLTKHPELRSAMATLRELDGDESSKSSKSVAQLEHVLFEYERNLGVFLKKLADERSPARLSVKERQFVASKCEFYMSRAESVKAVIAAKKDARDVEQTRRRNSDIARERARSRSLQEEAKRRLSDAKAGESRRRGSGGSHPSFEPTVVPTNAGGPRRKSFTDSQTASRIVAAHRRPSSGTGAAAAARGPSSASSRTSHHRPTGYHSKAEVRRSRGSGTKPPVPTQGGSSSSGSSKNTEYNEGLEKQIVDDLLMTPPTTRWDDIVGLADAKTALQETVILPTLRPDIFTGLRSPPKGVLLFGPPGTGKTMIARACACESGFAFFAVSASSLTSKWVGEGEKMMKALFKVAYTYAPAVVFMDEVDSVLSRRKESGEHEASRRMKTEFLVQIDGVNSSQSDPSCNVLVIACTNLPWELDDAALRRFARRIYVPLPDEAARRDIIQKLLSSNANSLSSHDTSALVRSTADYSASDLTNLCKEAAYGPLRQLSMRSLRNIDRANLPPISLKHFQQALTTCTPSVSKELLAKYEAWEKTA